MKNGYFYILANKKNGTLYIGVTNDLIRRVKEHKEGQTKGFSQKYFLKKLVYYEEFGEIAEAIYREKLVKKWKREWKINLIEEENKYWKDLYYNLVDTEN